MLKPAALAFALAFALAAPARADVAPRGDEDCTLDKQCKDGKTCPTLGGQIDTACAGDMGKSGFTLKCQEQKAGVAKAVFCPQPQAKKGCGKSSVAPGDGEGGGWLLALAAATAATCARISRRVAVGLRRAPRRR